jgi:hypothetical protein
MACGNEAMMQSAVSDKKGSLRVAIIKQLLHCSLTLKGIDQWHELKEQYMLERKKMHTLKLLKATEVAVVVFGEPLKMQ